MGRGYGNIKNIVAVYEEHWQSKLGNFLSTGEPVVSINWTNGFHMDWIQSLAAEHGYAAFLDPARRRVVFRRNAPKSE
jgi:hypothetical protein